MNYLSFVLGLIGISIVHATLLRVQLPSGVIKRIQFDPDTLNNIEEIRFRLERMGLSNNESSLIFQSPQLAAGSLVRIISSQKDKAKSKKRPFKRSPFTSMKKVMQSREDLPRFSLECEKTPIQLFLSEQLSLSVIEATALNQSKSPIILLLSYPKYRNFCDVAVATCLSNLPETVQRLQNIGYFVEGLSLCGCDGWTAEHISIALQLSKQTNNPHALILSINRSSKSVSFEAFRLSALANRLLELDFLSPNLIDNELKCAKLSSSILLNGHERNNLDFLLLLQPVGISVSTKTPNSSQTYCKLFSHSKIRSDLKNFLCDPVRNRRVLRDPLLLLCVEDFEGLNQSDKHELFDWIFEDSIDLSRNIHQIIHQLRFSL